MQAPQVRCKRRGEVPAPEARRQAARQPADPARPARTGPGGRPGTGPRQPGTAHPAARPDPGLSTAGRRPRQHHGPRRSQGNHDLHGQRRARLTCSPLAGPGGTCPFPAPFPEGVPAPLSNPPDSSVPRSSAARRHASTMRRSALYSIRRARRSASSRRDGRSCSASATLLRLCSVASCSSKYMLITPLWASCALPAARPPVGRAALPVVATRLRGRCADRRPPTRPPRSSADVREAACEARSRRA